MKCSGGCRAGVSGGSSPLFEGLSGVWAISAAEKRTQHWYFPNSSSDLQWQGKRIVRHLGRESGSHCSWFWSVLRRTTSPPTVADYCRCIEWSWEEEFINLDWQYSMIVISKSYREITITAGVMSLELSRLVFLAFTVTRWVFWFFFFPLQEICKMHWNKSRGRDLEKLALNVFSWFCLPFFKGVAASCFSIISSELWNGHPLPQPVKPIVSRPVSDLVSSFCSRAVWHEIAGVGEEENAIELLKETQPTSRF